MDWLIHEEFAYKVRRCLEAGHYSQDCYEQSVESSPSAAWISPHREPQAPNTITVIVNSQSKRLGLLRDGCRVPILARF